jgi:M6 family metalloprotease-like protein
MLNPRFWREMGTRPLGLLTLGCLGLLIWIMVAALWISAAHAAPAPPIEITLEQPGGETFPAQPFGDEWNNGYETPSGYTIVRDPESGTWEYATEGPQGSLEPSGKAVGLEARPNVPKHLRSDEPSGPQAPEQAPALEAPALANPNSGTQRSLVILVQLQDQASLGSTAAQWNSRFFGATNSVQDYYDEVSYGQLDIAPATESHGTANDGVVGWLTMTTNHPNTAGNTGTANRTLTRDAVNAADASVDYASYDANGDGFLSSRELHVTVIVAGQEASGWRHLGRSVWGHAWSLFGTERPTVDGVVFGDSGHGGGYTQFGEWHGNHMATLGIMVHEMGHDLYLPDLYDTDPAPPHTDSEGVGNWSVMGGGSWLATPGTDLGSTPAHLDAWSKSYEGWLTPQRLSGTQAVAQAETNATAMQLRDNPGGVDWTFNTSSGTGEYFLVENRQRTGYDAALPGCGLLVWHIDETRTSGNTANADESRRLVDLEEADGLNNLDGVGNRGDAGDPYPGSSNNTQFNDTSNPNSRLYSGSSSGVASESMSGPCSSTMSAALTDPGAVQRPANDNFANAQSITGTTLSVSGTTKSATRESGEPDHYTSNPNDAGLWVGDHSVWYRWTAPTSGSTTIDTCQANIDSILAVYTGSALTSLSRVADNNNDFCGGGWGSKVTFNATAGTTYQIAVGDAGGLRESTFTLKLAIAKSTPPKVTSTVPKATATGVAPGANITATFSEAMDPKTVVTTPTDPANPNVGRSTTFKLMKAGTTNLIPAIVTYNPNTNTAILNPDANLRRGTKYKAAVTTGAKDLAGNQLDQDQDPSNGLQQMGWSFTIKN